MTITDDDGNGHAGTIDAVTIGSASQQDYQQQQQQQQQKQQQQKHGLLSRFRFRRRGNKKHTTNATENVNKKNADDDDEEVITIITMDDDDSYSCSSSSSSSSSSSFDEIDVLLARPVMGTSYCDPIVLDKSTVVSSLSSSSATAASLPVEAATAITDQQQQQEQQLQQEQKNINAIIHNCLQLLSSPDIDQNRLALQRMELLLKGRSTSTAAEASVSSSSSSSSDTIPHAAADVAIAQLLVYGGTLGSEAELVRYLFSTLICNTPGTATSLDEFMAENTSCADDDDNDEKEDADADALFDWILEYDPTTTTINSNTDNQNYDVVVDDDDDNDDDAQSQGQQQQHPEGKADGILHTHALRILSHALDKLTSTTTTTVTFVENNNNNNNNTTNTNTSKKGIASPLQGPMIIWKNIMQTLLDNIEHPARNINATGYSLRILRSLYEIEEEEQYDDNCNDHLRILRPLVQHSFVAQLVYLVDFGDHYHFPMIQTEALFLWNQCCPQINTQH